jgi:anti-sigma-K factor RskA
MEENQHIEKGSIEQYVLGLCNPAERAYMEQQRQINPAVEEAILRFELEWEQQCLRASVLPKTSVDGRIKAELEKRSTQATTPVRQLTMPRISINWQKSVAAAVLLLLGTSLYLNVKWYQRISQYPIATNNQNSLPQYATLPVSDFNVMRDPAITPVALYGVANRTICRCTLFWDQKNRKAYLMIHHLPFSSEKEDFQIWANVLGKSQNLGIINDQVRDRFIEISNVPESATSFFITLEKAGGAQTPTRKETFVAGTI